MKCKYQTEHQKKTGWTWWIRPVKRGYSLACCDCGLVHVLNFRIAHDGTEFQARRDNRKTAALRREQKKRLKKTGAI